MNTILPWQVRGMRDIMKRHEDFSNTLKDNEYLQFAVVTGILRVVKEGIFSGLNNLSVYTVLDSDFSDYFGLVDNEVKQGVGILWIKSKYWRS